MSDGSTLINPEKAKELLPVIHTTRRTILKGVLGTLTVFGLGNLFYGAYRFLAPGAGGGNPVEVSLNELPAGGNYHFQYGGSPGVIFRDEDGSFRAFSLVCTHLACTVVWNSEKKEFTCPCHDGFFDAEGKVLSGPPPAPLERWKVDVRGDKVVVGVA